MNIQQPLPVATVTDAMPGGRIAPIVELADSVSAAADEIDRTRRLPSELVQRLKAAGAFRTLIPEELGGLGVDFLDHMHMVRQLAERDASTAWCINQAGVIATTSLWLPEQSSAAVWANPDAAVANGPPMGGLLTRTSNGYRLSGRWGFSSGCQHATHLVAAAKVDGGKAWRIAYLNPADVTFHDTWQVQGLRGTGSFEFSVENLAVEHAWTGDQSGPPTFDCVPTRIPTGLMFAVSFAALALGVARAGLDACVDLAHDKVPRFTAASMRNDPDAQKMLGEAETCWRAAHAFLFTTVAEVFDQVRGGARPSKSQRVSLRMAGTHTIREALAVMDRAYAIAGSTAIYRDNPLQRRFQDLHVISQHLQGRLAYYGAVGRYLLGVEHEEYPFG